MGLLLNVLCIILRLLSMNYFWEGASCGIPAGLPFRQEGQEFPKSFYKEISASGRKLLGAEIPISDLEGKQINTLLLYFSGGKKIPQSCLNH